MSDLSRDGNEIEQRVIQVLDGLGLSYEMIAIDPAYADTAQFCERYGYAMDQSGNTIIVGSKKEPKQYAAAVVKATRRLDVNHTVKKLMGVARLSFATSEETMALTGMMIGGVTVFALPPDLPIYVDDTLLECDRIILGGGSRASKILVTPEVLSRLPNATIIPGLSGASNAAE
jgi:prolyl-tRNA editing enzyme YbaK/EbsC (Cys-tRNA(Pro) deacylase)